MLVFGRRLDESITIGDNIKITVIDIAHGVVRLGIQADRSIPVHRTELYEKIQKGRKNAETTNMPTLP